MQGAPDNETLPGAIRRFAGCMGRYQRLDKTRVQEFNGNYGEYLINKIGKVFPVLKDDVL